MPSWKRNLICCESLIHRGENVARIGQFTSKPLPESAHPNIVDCASKNRTEFGDIWLLANCKFVIAWGCTGIYWVAATFGKPTVIADYYHLYKNSYCPQDLYFPQLAWSRSEKTQIVWEDNQAQRLAQVWSLIEGDLEIVKNTAEEITEVVLEMNQRIDGTWVETDEDIELQERFKKLRRSQPPWKVQQSVRIGAAFLRCYKHLL